LAGIPSRGGPRWLLIYRRASFADPVANGSHPVLPVPADRRGALVAHTQWSGDMTVCRFDLLGQGANAADFFGA